MTALMDLLGFRTTINGIAGQGKTYLSGLIFDGWPGKAVYFDTVGTIVKMPMQKHRICFNVRRDITGMDAYKIISTLKSREVSCVIVDLSNRVPSELVAFADVFSKALLRERWNNLLICIDEIGDYIPQGKQANGSAYSKELERLARIGRNMGITGVVGCTQRLTKPDKDVVAISESIISFKTSYPLDLNRWDEITGLGEMAAPAIRRELTGLPVGDYFIWTTKGEGGASLYKGRSLDCERYNVK